MRVFMTVLRKRGRPLPEEERRKMQGTWCTRQLLRGAERHKVAEFIEDNCGPGEHLLFKVTLKTCQSGGGTVMTYAGMAEEDGAWVAQEWAVDVKLALREPPVGGGWLKPPGRNAGR